MKYIGADVHISSIDFCVVDEKAKVIKRNKISTSAKAFIEFIQSIPKPRKVFIEEGCLASWLLETANDHGEELIITDAKQNHWIGNRGQKNDKIDAEKLAHLARGGYINQVHHPVGYRRRYKELVFHYHDTVKTAIRIKNKIKARFRSNGVACTGSTVYSKNYRKEWFCKLPKDKLLR
ncbi:transposase, partial [Candidatus Auribacterota bacterium]